MVSALCCSVAMSDSEIDTYLSSEETDTKVSRAVKRCISMKPEYNKNPKSKTGRTVLHLATYHGQEKIYKLISKNLKDKNPRDSNGVTPLHEAAKSGKEEMVKFIQSKIKDQYPLDNFHKTPRDYAIENSFINVASLFEIFGV